MTYKKFKPARQSSSTTYNMHAAISLRGTVMEFYYDEGGVIFIDFKNSIQATNECFDWGNLTLMQEIEMHTGEIPKDRESWKKAFSKYRSYCRLQVSAADGSDAYLDVNDFTYAHLRNN